MSSLYQPSDTWPEHDKPHWRKPMQQAQAAGWRLEYIGAPHTFGHVICPAGEHKFKIDKTASGSTFWAKEASKIITRNCRHGLIGVAGKVKARQDEASAALLMLTTILDSVEHDIAILEEISEGWERAAQLERRRDALLLRLETAELTLAGLGSDADSGDDADISDSLIDETLAEVTAVDDELDAELGGLNDLEPGPDAAALRAQLDDVDAINENVEKIVGKLTKRPVLAADLRANLAAARARHKGLATRLGVLERRSPPDG
ncbi:MAG: hypothetical protein JWO60_3129 [Frankiales bacterium]|nr:hypothetical protein [Frankiales bacterium]